MREQASLDSLRDGYLTGRMLDLVFVELVPSCSSRALFGKDLGGGVQCGRRHAARQVIQTTTHLSRE